MFETRQRSLSFVLQAALRESTSGAAILLASEKVGSVDSADTLALISRVDLFRVLTEGQRRNLAQVAGTHLYQAGEVIFTQGESGAHLMIVASGRVEVVRERPDGAQYVLNQLGPGLFFGEMAILDDCPRTATVTALEDTLILALWSGHFRVQLDAHPEMALAILPEISRRWRQALDRLNAIA